jgi:uncharacterized protein YbgA (DUF1722 family)/uncharacterized protein YbbK (DUF523 family)
MKFNQPKIVVSKCLGFANCRYNGQTIPDKFLNKLKDFVEIKVICPEVEIGLGVPRKPIRIVKDNLVQQDTNLNLTNKMNKFSEEFLDSLKEVDGFILKNRSPSCGLTDVKNYLENTKKSRCVKKTAGFFGRKVLKKFPKAAIEDEGRLKNFKIRENFLIKIFTLNKFKEIKKKKKIKDLVEFQEHNKYLFMAYNQKLQKNLGKIVANLKKQDIVKIYENYEKELLKLLANPYKNKLTINALNHIYGYFNNELNKKEKDYFSENLEEFRNKKIPFSTVNHLLYSWALRFNKNYLLNQTIFMPYPEELIEITDSGKGRDL